MVIGKQRLDRPYKEDSFEQKLYELIGQDETVGLHYDFLSLHVSFQIAEAGLIENSKLTFDQYKASEGDYEVQRSYKNAPEFYAYINPPLETLREAYFVTIHSIFEKTWVLVRQLCKHYFGEELCKELNSSIYRTLKKSKVPETVIGSLKKVILRYHTIFVYNNLRNILFHGKGRTSSDEKGFNEILECINNGQIKDIRLINASNIFSITSLQFIGNYSD